MLGCRVQVVSLACVVRKNDSEENSRGTAPIFAKIIADSNHVWRKSAGGSRDGSVDPALMHKSTRCDRHAPIISRIRAIDPLAKEHSLTGRAKNFLMITFAVVPSSLWPTDAMVPPT